MIHQSPPRETKVHREWSSELLDQNFCKWLKPMSQTMNYMAHLAQVYKRAYPRGLS